MYQNTFFKGKYSVNNHLKIRIGHLSKITGVNIGEVNKQQTPDLTDAPLVSTPAYHNDSYKINEQYKLIKIAKSFGFSPPEIKGFMVYWNKRKS